MNIPLPDSGIPVKLGDTHFVYKSVYHPIVWINELPYRPRVETLVIKDGEMLFLRVKEKDNRGSSGNNSSYELPGGSIDADCSPIEQARNEVNEEGLISIKDIYDSGIQYYEDYPSGYIMSGGDTPLEYQGHISNVYVAEYSGIYSKNMVDKKDLDPGMAENCKFRRIVEVVNILREEHVNALLSSDFVKPEVKGAIRILRSKYNKDSIQKSYVTPSDIVGELVLVSKHDTLTSVSPDKINEIQGEKLTDSKVRVYTSVKNALSGFDVTKDKISNGDFMTVYTINDKSVEVYTPSNEESPSSKITGELWVKTDKPISVTRMGIVQVFLDGSTNRFYYGKDSTYIGEVLKCDFKWVVKAITSKVVTESSTPVPGNKLYHGSTYEITSFKPMALDLGNALEEPGWSTFTFADYILALRFGLMRSIQKIADIWKDRCKDVVCSWDIVESKPYVSASSYKILLGLMNGFKFYIYTIDATNLDVGIGNDDRYPEYTFRESNVIPEKTDVVIIDEPLLKENLIVVKDDELQDKINEQERMAKYHHVRGWYSAMMTRDYKNGEASAQLQKAVSDGDLKPGDDIRKYMSEHGISFGDDSVSYSEPVPEKSVLESMREELSTTSSQMYMLSNENLDGKVLKPRVPSNFLTVNGYEDNTTKRVCFSPSIDKALSALSRKLTGETLFVHVPSVKSGISLKDIKYPSTKEVPDSSITGEMWVTKDVPLTCIGSIYVTGPTRGRGHSYTYGNGKTAELYDWSWEWKNKFESPMEAAIYSKENKYPIFIVLMHTGTFLSNVIKGYTHDMFSHAAISFNSKLSPMFSFGTKKFGGHDHGFTHHEITDEFYQHYDTEYSVYVMYVNETQRAKMVDRVAYFVKNESKLKYGLADLVACAMQIPTDFRKKWFCSRFVMNILGQGIDIGKAPSLWTPQQIASLDNISLVNSGKVLRDYDYRVTERNLKLIQKQRWNDVTVQEPVTENFIFSKKNLYINYEAFQKGTTNVCLVTGLSGSGKTTLGSKIANENNAELIELDMFEHCYIFENDGQLKECGQVFYDYLSSHKDIWNSLKNKSIHGEELGKEIDKFLKYCINWCKKDKKNRYVIEGVQIYSFLTKEDLGNTPIIFVGTSALKSLMRRLKRTKSESKDDFKREISELPQCIAWYIDNEKSYKAFRDAVLESTEWVAETKRSELPDDEFGLPELRKYPLDSEKHVKSAIKFFNYVNQKDEEELAKSIKEKMRKFNMDTPPITTKNRFSKYVLEDGSVPFNKDGCRADWSILDKLSEEDRTKVLMLSSKYFGKPVLYTNSLIIDEKVAGVIHMFRDLSNPTMGEVFHLIDPAYSYIDGICDTLIHTMQCDLTCYPVDGIEFYTIEYNNCHGKGEYLPMDMNSRDIVDMEYTRAELKNKSNGWLLESWIPLMEAPNDIDEDANGDTPEDYTADATTDDNQGEEDTHQDYTEDVDNEEQPEEEEPQQDDQQDNEQQEEEPTDYTNDADTGDDLGMDDEGGENGNQDDDQQDTDTPEESENNGNLFDNNVLKNYSLLKNFEKLYELVKEVSDSLDSRVMPTKLQNTVLAQVLKNMSSIKEFILSYVKFQFSEDNYSQNLYYYNIVLQSLKLNLELLKRNKELEAKNNNFN